MHVIITNPEGSNLISRRFLNKIKKICRVDEFPGERTRYRFWDYSADGLEKYLYYVYPDDCKKVIILN